jgi:hypothetical protein
VTLGDWWSRHSGGLSSSVQNAFKGDSNPGPFGWRPGVFASEAKGIGAFSSKAKTDTKNKKKGHDDISIDFNASDSLTQCLLFGHAQCE